MAWFTNSLNGPRARGRRAPAAFVSSLAVAALAAGCGGCRPVVAAPATQQPMSEMARLGDALFHDPALSASGRMACATCHDEASGFTPGNGLAVQRGGPLLDRAGVRATPDIRYLAHAAPFRIAEDGAPEGGLFWDGRASSLADQAAQPFLNPLEMANGSKAEVISRLAAAPYAGDFLALFGPRALDDVEGAYLRMTLALQQYQREDVAFRPFTSKYDAFLRGEASLSPRELRGLALFNAPSKGNCAACPPTAAEPAAAAVYLYGTACRRRHADRISFPPGPELRRQGRRQPGRHLPR
jgi:cytochrome c peroxidase